MKCKEKELFSTGFSGISAAFVCFLLIVPENPVFIFTGKCYSPVMNAEKFTVLGIGIATMDYLFTVASFPVKDTKIHCSSFITQGGGNCANTMVALSRLGVHACLYTCIGKDAVGREIKGSLKAEGVDTDTIIELEKDSPLSVIIVGENDSSRTIIHRPGMDYNSLLPSMKHKHSGFDLLYSDGRFSATAFQYARNARDKGIPVIVEAERTGLDVEQLFPYANILITSQAYHRQTFGNEDFEENITLLKKKGPGVVITTLGEQGCICLAGGSVIRNKAYKTHVVDTTGAGDAFCAGIVYGTLKNWEMEKRLDFASRIAALKCRELGARAGLPYLHEVQDFF